MSDVNDPLDSDLTRVDSAATAPRPQDALSLDGDETAVRDYGDLLGRVGRYFLLEKLGQGGFGAVYRAIDTKADVEVAVKALPPLVSGSVDEMVRIRRNYALVSRLAHPHIATVRHLHQVDETDSAASDLLGVSRGDYLVVMEYVPGYTLSGWRQRFTPDRRMPPELAEAICSQVAAALDYAHSQRIVHRDIKPSNVMLVHGANPETILLPDGTDVGVPTVKVLDFGLAAEIRSSLSRVSRETEDTSGTRPYMAPEQWTGRRQGAATDQYSLAALYYELVSGAVPFASAFETNDTKLMMSVVETRMPEPLEVLGAHRNGVLMRGLAKDPEERFRTCTSFVGALGVETRSKSPRLLLFAAALLVAGAVVAGVFAFPEQLRTMASRLPWLRAESQQDPPPDPIRAPGKDTPLTGAGTGESGPDAAESNPHGRQVAATTGPSATGETQISSGKDDAGQSTGVPTATTTVIDKPASTSTLDTSSPPNRQKVEDQVSPRVVAVVPDRVAGTRPLPSDSERRRQIALHIEGAQAVLQKAEEGTWLWQDTKTPVGFELTPRKDLEDQLADHLDKLALDMGSEHSTADQVRQTTLLVERLSQVQDRFGKFAVYLDDLGTGLKRASLSLHDDTKTPAPDVRSILRDYLPPAADNGLPAELVQRIRLTAYRLQLQALGKSARLPEHRRELRGWVLEAMKDTGLRLDQLGQETTLPLRELLLPPGFTVPEVMITPRRHRPDDADGRLLSAMLPPVLVRRTSSGRTSGDKAFHEMVFVLVPPGVFTLGEATVEGLAGDTWLTDPHPVRITHPFYMARFETTIASFRAYQLSLGREQGQRPGDGGRPVTGITYPEALRFCNWLGSVGGETEQLEQVCACTDAEGQLLPSKDCQVDRKGEGFRLPTEAEWEYAATYGGAVGAPAVGREDVMTVEEALKHTEYANALGIHMMNGNVHELVLDWLCEYPKGGLAAPRIDPLGRYDQASRALGEPFLVHRGASWKNTETDLEICASFRGKTDPASLASQDAIGFRVVLPVPVEYGVLTAGAAVSEKRD